MKEKNQQTQIVLGTPANLTLQEGKSYRGSLKVVRDSKGRQFIVNRIFNTNTKQAKVPEAVTEHGYVQIFPFVHKVKFVFDFKVDEPDIADTMMDEASELADFFLERYQKAKTA